MVPNIPVPTDNLWKFAALFGLVLIVTCIAGFIYVHQTTNALVFESVVERAVLEEKARADPLSAKKIAVIDRKLEIATGDRPVLIFLLALIAVLGIVSSGWGFLNWARIQPSHDRLLELQVAKAEREERMALEEALKNREPS